MIDHFFVRPRVRDRIRANPLGAWIPDYMAYLDARGHPRSTIRRNVRVVEHFGVWLASKRISPEDVTRTTVRSFFHEHLPDCHCPTPAPTYPRQARAALGHLLRLPGSPFQRRRPASPPTPVEAILELYREHLRTSCGLADSTCSLSNPSLRPGDSLRAAGSATALLRAGRPSAPRTR